MITDPIKSTDSSTEPSPIPGEVVTSEVPPTPPPAPFGPPRRRFGRWLILLLSLALLICLGIIAFLVSRGSVNGDNDRTVTVTGQATLQETPDQFVFYPNYTFQNADKAAALDAMTKKSDALVAGLKKLGVADSAIKTNSDGYGMPMAYDVDKGQQTYNLMLTVTLKDKAQAQKVQDYLVTTAPSGGVSPSAGFSDAKRKSIESKARDEASKDARAKADQSAKNLGFKVGKVKSIADGSGFGGVVPMNAEAKAAGSATDVAQPAAPPQLSLQPGQNDVTYSVTVVYEIK
jgi:uncharacterized protein YggE